MIRIKFEFQISKSFEKEQAAATDRGAELIASHAASIEICNLLHKVADFWQLVNLPVELGLEVYAGELIDNTVKAVNLYASLIQQLNQDLSDASSPIKDLAKLTLSTKPQEPNRFQQCVLTANYIESVREALILFVKHINNESQEYVTRSLQEDRFNAFTTYLIDSIERILDLIVEHKVSADLETQLFYLFESPETVSAEEVNFGCLNVY